MIFYVLNNEGICIFVDQISVSKDIQSSLKLTKNIDVARHHVATKSINCWDLTLEKADKSVTMLNCRKKVTNYLHICVEL